MTLTLSFQQEPKPFNLEWRWTGFTPATLLLRDDMEQMLRYCGSVPRQGITYVRIHYLLNLVKAKNLGTDQPIYDWGLLEKGFDRLVENRLVPFVELMGNPSGYFTNYEDPDQARAWKLLVRDLVRHFTGRYGQKEIQKWYFETWNEPDVGWWKQSTASFLVYYDACSEGLREADPTLPFGGPGTTIPLSERLRALLQHVDTGKNFFTGEPVRMDFLSIHEKGAWQSPHDLPIRPEKMVALTRRLQTYLADHHPRLLKIPLMNNECDPMVGWADPHTWHAVPFYPAIMTKTLVQHLETLVDQDGSSFTLLGNDHGFVGDWSQRTLLCRFAASREPDAPFDFVKKSALHWHTGFSLLGDHRYPVKNRPEDDNLWILPTSFHQGDEKGYAWVISRSENNPRFMRPEKNFMIHAEGLEPGEYHLTHYRIDEAHGNPFAVYEENFPQLDMPVQFLPDADLLNKLRNAHELTAAAEPTVVSVGPEGNISFSTDLPSPAVQFTLLLRTDSLPAEVPTVEGLRALRYEGLTPRENVLLTWFPSASRSIIDHVIEFSPDGQEWSPLAHPPLLDGSFVHQRTPCPEGLHYRVRAKNCLGKLSPPSASVHR